jgi:hypothetical protein
VGKDTIWWPFDCELKNKTKNSFFPLGRDTIGWTPNYFLINILITIFHLCYSLPPYSNNDDNYSNKIPILKRTSKFFNGIHVEKHVNKFWFKNSDG